MRILIASPFLPWPLNAGGNAAQFATLKCLAPDHEFVVVTQLNSTNHPSHLDQLRKALPGVRFIGVGGYRREPGIFSPRFALRTARKIYKIARKTLSQPAEPPPAPHYPFHSISANFIQALKEELKNGVDIFQAEFAEMMPLGAWVPPTLPKLFIHHQVHFVYAKRFIQARGDPTGYSDFLEAAMRNQEIALLKSFDTVVTFSHDDSAVLRPLLNGVTIDTSPFPLPPDVEVSHDKPTPFNGTFCFVASEPHFPNQDALAWLLEEIWPKISAALPSAKLNIVGDWSEKTRSRLAGPKVNFTGFVPDLSPVLKGSVQLVPLRIGSGIRVKILVALALGAPVVTTRIGGEGLMGIDDKEMLVRDTADDFAAAAIELTRQPALWQSMCLAGRDAVLKNYSPESVRARRNQIYDRLLASRCVASSQKT